MEPYAYQQEAVDRMAGEPAFILADEMGLGKTVTVLAEIARSGATNILIVCPKSVMHSWYDHAVKMGFKARMAYGPKRNRAVSEYSGGVLIINWDAVRITPLLVSHRWDYIVADEAHYMKNRKAQRTKALKRLRADHKRALSGTPMVNRPDELWSILNWLYPKDYRSYWRFFERYCDYIIEPRFGYRVFKGAKNTKELNGKLREIMVRRLKEDVLKELPSKYYTKVEVELGTQQAAAYESMRRTALAWIEQEPSDQPLRAPSVLAQLTRLRQFATAYAQIDEDGRVTMSEPSSKLDAMMDLIEDTDSPVVVFSQFKQVISLAASRLDKAGIGNFVLTGDTPHAERRRRIEAFQEGGGVFLATLGAGGVGITLHKASTAIFLDRSWSPAQNLQAEDRLHRIGQKNAVQIINIMARKTVDYTVESRLEMKRDVVRRIIEGR